MRGNARCGKTVGEASGLNFVPHGEYVFVQQTAIREPDLLIAYREWLDNLSVDDICWLPYRAPLPFERGDIVVLSYKGLIRCMDMLEPYHPDRVARQFGRR